MNLGTLGLIFKFAIELEDKNLKMLNMLQGLENFEEVINNYSKRKKRLKRLRRENTTEMILEPIHDFESLEYKLEDEEQTSSPLSLKEKIIYNENVLESFYLDASKKTSFLSEVSSAFDKFAIEHQKNAHKFEKT